MNEPAKPSLTTTPVSRRFWDAAAEGRLELQSCRACGHVVHYPRVLCPRCWSPELEWRAVSGQGTVRTFTVVHRPGHPAWRDEAPYVVALIALVEGATLLSNVVDIDPADVRVGMDVEVRFARDGDLTLPLFGPRRATA